MGTFTALSIPIYMVSPTMAECSNCVKTAFKRKSMVQYHNCVKYATDNYACLAMFVVCK